MKRTVRAVDVLVGLLVVAVLAGQLLGHPFLLGFVQTDSMQPTLDPGDGFVAVPPPLVGGIDDGDVVTFEATTLDGGGLTTHRVVGERPAGYVTRGDANPLTDQQGAEPLVSRERVVAVALRVNGGTVVIPELGTVVEASQTLLAAVGEVTTVGGGPRQIATLLVALLTGAYVLDALVASDRGAKRSGRPAARDSGHDALRLLFLGAVVVALLATLSMVAASGTTPVEFDDGADQRDGPRAGQPQSVSLQLSNGGLAPTVAILESPAQAVTVSRDAVVVWPGERTTVNATITAPPGENWDGHRVVRHSYLGVLPVPVLHALHATHPWVAIAAVDLSVGAALVAAGSLLLGRGRVRFREGRRLGTALAVRRALRRRYR
jgi:signal peptidase